MVSRANGCIQLAHTSSPVSGSKRTCHGAGSRDMLAMAVSAIEASTAAESVLACDALPSMGSNSTMAAVVATGEGAVAAVMAVDDIGSSHTISPVSVLWKNTSPVASGTHEWNTMMRQRTNWQVIISQCHDAPSTSACHGGGADMAAIILAVDRRGVAAPRGVAATRGVNSAGGAEDLGLGVGLGAEAMTMARSNVACPVSLFS